MVSNYVMMNTMKEGSYKIMFSIEQIRMCTFAHPQVKLEGYVLENENTYKDEDGF